MKEENRDGRVGVGRKSRGSREKVASRPGYQPVRSKGEEGTN